MGQAIEVQATVVDDVAIFSTDRSITGQDGVSYDSAEAAGRDDRFPGRLASRLYERDGSLTSVFVASNQVVVRREGGWGEASAAALSDVIEEFFLFYPPEADPTPASEEDEAG